MSGLKNEPITGGKFLNFKEGAIVSAIDGEKKTFTAVEGRITELDIRDEVYKGKEYRKIILFILDDENTTWQLGFPLESGYGNAFCSLSPNINFAKDVKISGGVKEMENDRTYGMMFIKQQTDGDKWENLKWHFKKDSIDLPAAEIKRDRTGEYKDYSTRNDFFHKLLIEEIRPAVLKANGLQDTKASEGKKPRKAAR